VGSRAAKTAGSNKVAQQQHHTGKKQN